MGDYLWGLVRDDDSSCHRRKVFYLNCSFVICNLCCEFLPVW